MKNILSNADDIDRSSWKSFTDIFDIQGGTQPPKSQFIYEPKDGYIRLLQIRDFGENPVPTYIPQDKKLKTCVNNDLLIGRYGASVGRICTGMDGAYNVALAKVIPLKEIDGRYTFHILNSNFFQSQLRKIERSAQNGFNKEDLADIYLPFVSDVDQQRAISKKLDLLISKVGTTSMKIAQAKKDLSNFRQSILTAATNGNLTKVWRRENRDIAKSPIKYVLKQNKPKVQFDLSQFNIYDLPDGWEWKQFWETAVIKSNLVPPDKYPEYVLVAPDNIERNTGRLLEKKLVKEIKPISAKHLFFDGQIVYSKIRPYLSKLILADFDGLCSADMYPISAKINVKYLMLYMLSKYFLDNVSNLGTRTLLPKTNQEELNSIPVPVPTLEEQEQIVKKVDHYFDLAASVEKLIESTESKVSNLTQAILSKTFKDN